MRVSTPEKPRAAPTYHHTTPVKARVKDLTRFAQKHYPRMSQRDIFEEAGVGHTRGYKILKGTSTRRIHNNPYELEPRGRKRILSDTDLGQLEDIIEEGGFDVRVCGWQEIGIEIWGDACPSVYTLQRYIHERGYYKCVACQKPYLISKSLK